MSGLRWRIAAIVSIVVLLGWFAAANFVPAATRKATWLWPDQGIRLGLDLQGGIHWVLSPDLDAALEHELDVLRGGLREELEGEHVTLSRAEVEQDRLVLETERPEDLEKVRDVARQTDVLREVSAEGNTVTFELTDAWAREVRERGISQMLEVLRRRIDDPIQGVPESVVTRQGADRVLIQIPGGQLDREQARALLRKTGFLEFKLVLDQAPTEELLRKKHPDGLPPETEIALEEEKGGDRVLNAYLVQKAPDLTGDFLTDARSSLDKRYGWIVNFSFNSEGARRFASQDAAELAVILRAGSLPIPVQIEEERTLGPALGADSIRRGVRAGLVAFLIIIAFVCWYYRLAGIYASFALTANVVLLIGLMSMAKATLTMPGIAALILTVGMAIDANVIIYERIREELRVGKTPRAAIRTGFGKALWTVLDANVTTLITALILFQYGTGPIKGFAVALSIGILTSVFSALAIPRVLFELHPGSRPAQSLSI